MEFSKIVVGHLKVVVPRSSIRGFKDDYHHLDANFVVLAGETRRKTRAVSTRSPHSRCKGKVDIERLSGRDAFYEVVS